MAGACGCAAEQRRAEVVRHGTRAAARRGALFQSTAAVRVALPQGARRGDRPARGGRGGGGGGRRCGGGGGRGRGVHGCLRAPAPRWRGRGGPDGGGGRARCPGGGCAAPLRRAAGRTHGAAHRQRRTVTHRAPAELLAEGRHRPRLAALSTSPLSHFSRVDSPGWLLSLSSGCAHNCRRAVRAVLGVAAAVPAPQHMARAARSRRRLGRHYSR
mmetsp:Transcript_16328/g.38819  ORF Transcript_16328/g.38819 Transcript_16328/m.38819 type:complete len:214 (+) Transcript_16328:946-1587(+)